MSWRILVRHGPRVEKLRAEDLEAALDLVEREGRALAAGPGRTSTPARMRRPRARRAPASSSLGRDRS